MTKFLNKHDWRELGDAFINKNYTEIKNKDIRAEREKILKFFNISSSEDNGAIIDSVAETFVKQRRNDFVKLVKILKAKND